MTTVRLNAAGIGGLIQTQFSGNVQVASDGTITVDVRDAPTLLAAGASYINSVSRWQAVSAARAGSAGQIVASTTFANGTLSIANQPDVPRQVSVRVFPGTTAISAGNVALTYVAADGTTTTDNISAITAANTVVSTNSSKGVLKVNSVVVTAVAGGASPKIQVDDLNYLSMAVDPGYQNFQVLKASVDGADEGISTVHSSAASVVPSTAPNGTHTFGFAYSYIAPDT